MNMVAVLVCFVSLHFFIFFVRLFLIQRNHMAIRLKKKALLENQTINNANCYQFCYFVHFLIMKLCLLMPHPKNEANSFQSELNIIYLSGFDLS